MKNLKLFYYSCILLFAVSTANAQIGIGTTSPNASAKLDISSTDKGLLIPRMTTTQRDNIESPSQGLMVFNTETQCLDVYNATDDAWDSNCGDEISTRATYTPDCGTVAVQGTYTQDTALVPANNTITIDANVAQTGAYAIVASGNGMVFTASGTFNATGNQTITLQGQGTPQQEGNNVISFIIGETVCSATITVAAP